MTAIASATAPPPAPAIALAAAPKLRDKNLLYVHLAKLSKLGIPFIFRHPNLNSALDDYQMLTVFLKTECAPADRRRNIISLNLYIFKDHSQYASNGVVGVRVDHATERKLKAYVTQSRIVFITDIIYKMHALSRRGRA